MITQNAQIYRVQGTSAYLDSVIRPKFLAYNTQSKSLQYSVSGLGWDYFLNSNQVQSLIETNFLVQNSFLPLSGGSVYGNISASSFVKSGGTSTQFLKADGSVDSNSYATNTSLGNYLPLSGGTLTGNLIGSNSAQVKFSKDIVPTTAVGNNNFLNSPIVSQTISNGNYSNVAGIGFHNAGINASMLYYDPSSSNFMHNNNNGGIYTLWDSRNFNPGNYLQTSVGSYKLWGGAGVVDADAISGPVSAIPAVTIPAGLLNTRTIRVTFSYQTANVGVHASYIMVNLGGIQYTDSTFGAGSNGNSFGKVTLTYKAYLDGSAGKVGQVAWCEGKHDTGVFLSNQSYVGSEMSTLNLNNPLTLYVSIIENSPTATVWVYQPMIEVL